MGARCLILLFVVPFVLATDYFVDCDYGNNSNAGTSRDAAWQFPPGSNSGNIISGGDRILIKSGSDCTDSGTWNIDEQQYGDASSKDKIEIIIDDTWGNGDVIFDDKLTITRKYVKLAGTPSYQFHFAADNGAVSIQDSDYSDFSWIDIGGVDNYCLIIGNTDYSNFSDIDVGPCNMAPGGTDANIGVGANWAGGSSATNLIFTRVNSHDCSYLRNNRCDGWNGWGVEDSVWKWCDAYDNLRRGFDFGEYGGAYCNNLIFLNSRAWDNGDFSDTNAAGFWFSSEGNFFLINSITSNQNQGIGTYEGSTVYLYNNIFDSNRYGVHISDATDLILRNNIAVLPSIQGSAFLKTYGEQDIIIDSDYNMWYSPSASNYIKVAHKGGESYTVENQDEWQISQDIHHIGGYTPFFGWTEDYTINDSSSSLIDSGKPILSPAEVLFDFNDYQRPFGDKWDIGPYEYMGCVELTLYELIEIMDNWKTGKNTILQVMEAIGKWKDGC